MTMSLTYPLSATVNVAASIIDTAPLHAGAHADAAPRPSTLAPPSAEADPTTARAPSASPPIVTIKTGAQTPSGAQIHSGAQSPAQSPTRMDTAGASEARTPLANPAANLQSPTENQSLTQGPSAIAFGPALTPHAAAPEAAPSPDAFQQWLLTPQGRVAEAAEAQDHAITLPRSILPPTPPSFAAHSPSAHDTAMHNTGISNSAHGPTAYEPLTPAFQNPSSLGSSGGAAGTTPHSSGAMHAHSHPSPLSAGAHGAMHVHGDLVQDMQSTGSAVAAGGGGSTVPAFPEYPPLRFSPSVAARPDAVTPAATLKQLRFYKRRCGILERADRDAKRTILRLRSDNARLNALVQAAGASNPLLLDPTVQRHPVSSLAAYNPQRRGPFPLSPAHAYPPLQQQLRGLQATVGGVGAWGGVGAQNSAHQQQGQGVVRSPEEAGGQMGHFHELQRLDAFLQPGGTPPMPAPSGSNGSFHLQQQPDTLASLQPGGTLPMPGSGLYRLQQQQPDTTGSLHGGKHLPRPQRATPSVAGVLQQFSSLDSDDFDASGSAPSAPSGSPLDAGAMHAVHAMHASSAAHAVHAVHVSSAVRASDGAVYSGAHAVHESSAVHAYGGVAYSGGAVHTATPDVSMSGSEGGSVSVGDISVTHSVTREAPQTFATWGAGRAAPAIRSRVPLLGEPGYSRQSLAAPFVAAPPLPRVTPFEPSEHGTPGALFICAVYCNHAGMCV